MKHLVVMVKAPRIGRVKSRLAQDIGLVGAWAFQRRTLAHITRTLHDPRWTCWLAIAPDRACFAPRGWPPGWNRLPQGQGDLGARMLRPWLNLPPGPVVIVGSDIPAIKSSHIHQAFRALGRHDMVFGPAPDGGYWLVGARRRPCLINPFGAVRWSTKHALSDTVAGVPKDRTVGFIDTLNDVDDARDL